MILIFSDVVAIFVSHYTLSKIVKMNSQNDVLQRILVF